MNSSLMDDVLYLNESDIEANTCIRLQAQKMHGKERGQDILKH